MRALVSLALAVLAAPAAWADTALLIANTRHDSAQTLRYAGEIAALERPLSQAGFDVIVVENGTAEALRAGVSALLAADETERVLVAVAGHVVRSQRGTWVLGTDADTPDLATVGGQGMALDVLLEIAGRAPGRALVLVGQEPRRIDLGPGLARGMGPVEAPQGVTVLSGAPDDLADLVLGVALRPGADLAGAVASSRDLRSHGFLSPALPFLGALDTAPAGPAAPSAEEAALWAAVQELNSVGAYRAYLEQYPEGAFAAEARAAVAGLEAQPFDPLVAAEAVETALGLSRAARQQIQRDLTLLDFDTRGIDGIFGRGTRGAIRAWQEVRGFEATGFLTGPQIGVLREAAVQRAAELEEEARRRAEAEARADRAFWQAIGEGADEAGLRAYLERYPSGQFAAIARARLDAIEAERRAQAEAAERATWDAVRQRDTVEAYRRYLSDYPQGLFVEMARARIAELESGLSPQEQAQAEAREAALNLAPQMRGLVEQRLAAMGLDPGPVDGVFDVRTRQAIRAYQQARGIPATGYLDQLTVVRLLAEAIGGRIFD
ncbi:peptidoglycan-binding domain-containing protein [Roseicyclus persicicus]|uniref:Peptidoglycan-binding protein n=1 Tax=Roseicyclus persicicus TaxID=2650661 RepID=A0A7X6GZI7_9RHOB|nr:peptidoglycan-binding domain-containing protein [Roseibacterium persicicum]NKX45260.1 peptidoglycan-binding protein [Roseibacterium persicicum]